jgi:sortase A
MKKKATKIIVVLIFLAGLSLLLYPFIANQWNTYRQSRLISSYNEAVADKEAEGSIDYESEWERARAYNEALLPSILPDSFAIAEAAEEDDPQHQEYLSCLDLAGDGMMGRVEIPKINVDLPIYHTTDESVLEQAAGHLEGSSLPVGGESTHAVISAHRGLPSASLFTDLDELKEGDHFLIHVLDEVLCYQVDQVSTVEPEETESLSVVEGEDLVTLMTCTPYGVNSHRLLVRGHRVPYEPAVVEEETTGSLFGTSVHTNYLLWVIVGLAVTGGFIVLLLAIDRRRKKIASGYRRAAKEPDTPDAPGQAKETDVPGKPEKPEKDRPDGE